MPTIKIKSAVESYCPANNRSQLVKQGTNTFVLDAYNANPTSMKVALENFSKIEAAQKVVILGDMLELGDYSATEHTAIIEIAQRQKYFQIILVGELFAACANKANIIHFDVVADLIEWFEKQNFKNTWFLVKGSRGIRLEQLIVHLSSIS